MSFYRTASFFVLIASLGIGGCTTPLILAGAAAGGATAAHDRRSVGAQIDDQTIEMRALSRMAKDPAMTKAEDVHVNVTSFNGIVLLTGETRTADLRQRAERYAREVPNVRKVYNEIRVEEPSGLGARSGDTWVTTKIKTKLLTSEHVDGTRIKVVTEASIVYLMGLVSRGESNIATSLASDTGGVTRIVRVFEYVD